MIETAHLGSLISIFAGADRVQEPRGEIALVFSDVDMPRAIDGPKLIERVHEFPAIELILTSGHERFENGMLPDHGTFLPKPYNASELAGLVARKLSPD